MKLRGIVLAAVLACGCNTCLNASSIPFDGQANNSAPDVADMRRADADGESDMGGGRDSGPGDIGLPDADMSCIDESDRCETTGRQCGELEYTDACGANREVDCGSCGEGGTCGEGGMCTCDDGFEWTGERCEDIDECADGTDDCADEERCLNTAGGFVCSDCPDGQVRDDADMCVDFDECAQGADNCDPLVECTNLDPFFACGDCPDGYSDTNGDGTLCEDIDECADDTDNCDTNATCTNDAGGFSCACNAGYTGNGISCTPNSSGGLIKSVVLAQFSLDGDNGRQPLPVGADATKVVPFASVTIENVEDDVEASLVDVWIDTSSNEVVVQRDKDDEIAFVSVYLVEFDTADVQSGSWSVTGFTGSTTLPQSVDPSRSFMTFSTLYNGIGDRDDAFVGGALTGNMVSFARFSNTGSASGHFYVVSAQNGEFTVNRTLVSIDAAAVCASETIAAVDLDQSFVLASALTTSSSGPFVASGENPSFVHAQCELTSATEIQCCRGAADDPIDGVGLQIGVQIVSFDPTLNGAVQRGQLDLPDVQSALTNLSPAVDATRSTPIFSIGALGAAIIAPEPASRDESAAFATLEFENLGSSLSARRIETASETTSLWWKVVTWPH